MTSGLDPAPAPIPRERLLARLRDGHSRLITLLAPAGFGKTTLARLHTSTQTQSATCDCLGVTTESELAMRLLAALGDAEPQRASSLSQEAMSAVRNPAALTALAIAAFREPGARSTLLIENVERIEGVRGASELLGSLLDRPHPDRQVVLCSREPVAFRTSRFAPPNETMVLRAADLRFDRDDIRRAFVRTDVDDAHIDAIESVTRGWPIAVLLLARFAADGQLDRILTNLHDIEYDGLFEYLANEVFGALDTATRAELLVACAVPDLTLDEWRVVRTDESARAAVLDIPFVAVDGDRVDVHPLVRAMVASRYEGELRGIVRTVAEKLLDRARGARSAGLFLRAGDHVAAARCLSQTNGTAFLLSDFPQTIVEIIGALDADTLGDFPELWSASTMARMYRMNQKSFLDENRRMWQRYRDAPELSVRLGVFSNIQNATALNGAFEEASSALAFFRASLSPQEQFLVPLCHLWDTCLRAFQGVSANTESLTPEQMAFLQADTTFAIWSYNVAARRQRLLGERVAEERHLSSAVAAARRSGDALTEAMCAADAAFGAWFWGDDVGMADHLVQLEACIGPRIERGFRFFLDCARGRGRSAVADFEEYKFRSFAFLMAAAAEADSSVAARLTREAVIAADLSGQMFGRIIARVAAAAVDPARHREFAAAAQSLAAATESIPLQTAVSAFASGSAGRGMLTAFLSRFEEPHRSRGTNVRVELLHARVIVDGDEIALRPRELQIVAALGTAQGPLDAGRLADQLWADAADSPNRVYVAMNRLRAKLGASLIASTPRGYALAPQVTVDVVLMEEYLRRIDRADALDATQRVEVRNLEHKLRSAEPLLASHEWFEEFRGRVAHLTRDMQTLLARDAAARDDHDETLRYAQAMSKQDPCDEVACELAMRAWMGKNDRPAALRCLRDYELHIKRELGVAPSRFLTEIVEEPIDR